MITSGPLGSLSGRFGQWIPRRNDGGIRFIIAIVLCFFCLVGAADTVGMHEILVRLENEQIQVRAATQDAEGFVYLTGVCAAHPDAQSAVQAKGQYGDVFVMKLDSGGKCLWLRRFGGNESDAGCALAVDAHGNVYVTGFYMGEVAFEGRLIDPIMRNRMGTGDAFIAKLSSDGELEWIRDMGGNKNDVGHCLTLDAQGNAYVAGVTGGTVCLGIGDDSPQPASIGLNSTFIAKVSPAGHSAWVKVISSQAVVKPYGIGVNRTGVVALAGVFSAPTDFDPGAADTETQCQGSFDAFVLSLDRDGQFAWVRSFGSDYRESCRALAMDSDGDIYVTGAYSGTMDFDPGTGRALFHCDSFQKGYLVKLNSTGDFEWVVESQVSGDSEGETLFLDRDERVYWGIHYSGYDGAAGDAHNHRVHCELFAPDGKRVWSNSAMRLTCSTLCMAAPDGRGNLVLAGALLVTPADKPDPGRERLESAGLIRSSGMSAVILAEKAAAGF